MVKATIKKDNYETLIEAGRRRMIADEPADLGGTDLGMNPIELLCSSLASCVSITLRMYADRKQMKLDEVQVTVEFDKETGVFQKDIKLFGALNDSEVDKLKEIAEKCPVNKILSKSNTIKSEVTWMK